MSSKCEEPAFGELTGLDIRSIRLRCIELAQEHTPSDDVVRLAGEWAQFVLNGSPAPLPEGQVEETARTNGQAIREAIR